MKEMINNQTKIHLDINNYFDDKSGKRNWLEKEDYDRKILH